MPNALITKLNEQRQTQVEFIDQLVAQAANEDRELVETERRSIDSASEVITGIDAQLEPLVKFENVRNSAHVIDSRLQQRAGASSTRTAPRGGQELADGEFRSFGDLYTESDQFIERGADKASVYIEGVDPVELAYQTRAVLTTTGTTSGNYGSTLLPAKQRFTQSQPELRTPLLDMIRKQPVETGSVDLLTWGEFAGSDTVAEGADKPETLVVNGSTSKSMETVAGWVKYTRQLAEDAVNFPAYLSAGITRDLLRKLQAKVAAVISGYDFPDTTGAEDQPLIEVLRMGIATVETAGFNPDIVIASPTVLAGLDLAVLNLGGSASTVMGRGQWNLTPVGVPGFSKVVVADASSAFVLYNRTGVRIYTTDSDISGAGSTATSDFRRNILTTLGETRALGAIDNPNAATEVVLTNAA